MFDPMSLAGAAVGLMVLYLKKLAGRTVERVGDDLDDATDAKVQALYERVKAKLLGDEYAAGLFKGVEAQPDSQPRQVNLQTMLAETLERDQEFADAIAQLVQQIQQTKVVTIQADDSGVVAGRDVHMRVDGGGSVIGRDQISHGTSPPPAGNRL
jgi:hypothetical protein